MTGPNDSSLAMNMWSSTSVNTVGSRKNPTIDTGLVLHPTQNTTIFSYAYRVDTSYIPQNAGVVQSEDTLQWVYDIWPPGIDRPGHPRILTVQNSAVKIYSTKYFKMQGNCNELLEKDKKHK